MTDDLHTTAVHDGQQTVVAYNLRRASNADVLVLAQARQWYLSHATLKALTTDGTPEALTCARVNDWAPAGAIDIAVDDRVPDGFVVPQRQRAAIFMPDGYEPAVPDPGNDYRLLAFVGSVLFVLFVVALVLGVYP